MPVVLLLLRLLLAAVFLVAAVGKFLDRPGSRRAFIEFGLPERVAPPLAIVLPFVELAVALLLLLPVTSWVGALGALGLLVVFIGGIAYNLARGRRPDCHCFGQIYSAPAGPTTLLRNGVLALAAGAVVVFGWSDAGLGALDWASGMSAGELAGLAVGATGLLAAVVLAWFVVQMAASLGRLQLALDELRARLDASPAATTRLPAQIPVGLPIGRVAPAFELSDLNGKQVSLASLVGERILMLAFIDPDCGPCRELMPDLARWQRRDDLAVVAISRGTVAANQREQRDHRLDHVLLQRDREVAAAYEVRGTPSAALVGPDGRIASSVAGGVDSVRELAARAPSIAQSRSLAATAAAPSSNGHAGPPRLAIGDRAPDIELEGVDGQLVTLARKSRKDTVVLFWRPSCGFCARIAPDVKQWAATARTGRTDLVLVALDDRKANEALELGANILLDPEMRAFGAFGASGTPIAVKLDRRGRVASPLAVGTDQVRALATAAGLAPPA